MDNNILLQGYCDNAEYQENRNSAQRIVNAIMEIVDKQLRDFPSTKGKGTESKNNIIK